MISDSIKNKVVRPHQWYILKTNKKWFNHYCEYVLTGKILHVGNGLGYASALIKEKNENVTSLDVEINPDTINKEDVILYEGERIPFGDASFDAVLCDYVIHHTPSPEKFIDELKRVIVPNGLLIVVEQTHENYFQYYKTVRNCRKQNKQSGQKVTIYWKSYFNRKKIRSFFLSHGLEILDTISEQRKSGFTEMFALRKID
jgi:ubiquinone/menaquinone biosynthesis C-methylase UbiE